MEVATVVISIVSKITELLVEPVIRQLRYMFCFNNFIEDLEKQEQSVNSEQERVQTDVSVALRNAEEIYTDVQTWLTDVDATKVDVNALKEEMKKDKKCFTKWCPNLIWRYKLSRRVAKKTIDLKNLKDTCRFQKVSHRAAFQDAESPSKDFSPSHSSELASEQIMEALTNDNIHIIGLYGMGGVGKTTLVKELAKKAIKKKLFEEFAMAVVSKTPDSMKIQDQLAVKLGLELDGKSKEVRANLLGRRLQDEKKKLLILDDVWKPHHLKKVREDLGIPFGDEHKNSKILLTTRRQHVCSSCEKQIQLNVLTEEEAWALFKINARLCDDLIGLNKVAEEVARECKGLPIAIVTVGRALKGKTLNAWEVAARRIKTSKLTEIRDVDGEENAYACLKLSYDELQREETKLCLLLCSLFPEDYEISIEDLARYAIGLGWVLDSVSIQGARGDILDVVEELIESSMLLEDNRKGCVKMHDMIRDVAIWISRKCSVFSQLRREFKVESCIALGKQLSIESFQSCMAVSLIDNNNIEDTEFSTGFVNPKLEILLAEKSKVSVGEAFMNVSEAALKGIKELKVLSITRGSLSIQSLEFLTNLQILELKYCRVNFLASKEEGNNLTSFQKLRSLKVLSFYGSSIGELPHEIGELSGLKVLDLRCCSMLKSIPPTMFRTLLKLEEFYIGKGSFQQWQVEGMDKNKSNVSLAELNSLSHLAILWLDLNEENIPKDFIFPELTGYHMHISCRCDHHYKDRDPLLRYPTYPTPRLLCFKPSNVATVNACKELFSNVYDLCVWNNGECFHNIVPDMDHRGFGELISLDLVDCKMECLISKEQRQMPTLVQQNAFSNLEDLRLQRTNLREICNGNPPKGFMEKLRAIFFENVNQMVTIFPTKLWQALKVLETVTVKSCNDLQEVFNLDGLNAVTEELLSHLTKLELENLCDLNHIWKEPSTCCLGLKNLKFISIAMCNKLKRLFPITVAQGLRCLETLWVSECCQLVELFGSGDEAKINDGKAEILLPRLRALGLIRLPSLINLCPKGYHFKLPCSRELEVKECPEIATNITMATITMALSGNVHVKTKIGELESIDAHNCDALEYIIAVTNNEEQNNLILFRNISATSFIKLRTIEIVNCNKLKSLFPITVAAQGLPCLEYLCVSRCNQLIEVFVATLDTDYNDEKEMVLPKLRNISLRYLQRLINFCPRDYHLVLPALQELSVEQCSKIVANFTTTPNQNADSKTEIGDSREIQLRSIYASSCDELEHIIAVTKSDEEQKNLISFRSDISATSFINLSIIEIVKCNKLKSLFSITVAAQGLPCLEYLSVSECSQLVEVFRATGNIENNDEKEMVLAKLCGLKLIHLPSLISFCTRDYHFVLPRLQYLSVEECHKIVANLTVTPNQSVDSKTEASTSKEQLTIKAPQVIQLGEINVKECHELEQIITIAKDDHGEKKEIITLRSDFPPKVFLNLLQIEVHQCNKLKSLFPITIAQGLSNLESITVSGCNQLVEVFGTNEDEGDVKEEKIIELPKLWKLELEGLPSLINFCPIGYHFIFPCLEEMKLKKCPESATTRFSTPDKIFHAKTEATRVINVETTTLPGAIHAPLGFNHQDIEWKGRCPFYFGDNYHGKEREDEDNDGEEKEFKEEDGERTT